MSRNGKKQLGFKISEALTGAQERKIVAALERMFRDHNEGAGPMDQDGRTHDFVFHMVDWYDDLMRLAKVMKNPETASDDKWSDAVNRFLIHVSGHVAAAAKIAGHEPVDFELPRAKPNSRRPLAAVRASGS